jgi:hypothetical protein
VGDERAAEGVEHLQAAALELIAAARAFLDVAEDVVTDPERVSGAVASLATIIDLAGRGRRPPAADRAGAGDRMRPQADDTEQPGPPAGHERDDTGVRRIRRIDVT